MNLAEPLTIRLAPPNPLARCWCPLLPLWWLELPFNIGSTSEPSLVLRIHPYSTAAIDYKSGKVFGVCLSSERMKNNGGMNSISKSLIQILRDWWKISRLNCCPSCFQFKVQNLVPIIRFVILVSIFMLIFVFFHIIKLYFIKIQNHLFYNTYNG